MSENNQWPQKGDEAYLDEDGKLTLVVVVSDRWEDGSVHVRAECGPMRGAIFAARVSALRKRLPIPDRNPPDSSLHGWTFFGQPVQQAPMGSVFIVTLPADIEAVKYKMLEQIQQFTKERPDLYFIVVPHNVKLEAIQLDELKQLRDRLNEIIYDKERAK